MAREKGSGKTPGSGRKKGTPNKITGELREFLTPIITKYLSDDGIGDAEHRHNLEQDLAKMEPEDRARTITNLVPYVMPKLASVEVKSKPDEKSLRDELDELENSE